MEKLMIISADGHAMPRMREYRPYLESRLLDKFDAFLEEYEAADTPKVFESASARLDPEELARWMGTFDDERLHSSGDPERRIAEMEGQGVVAEVLFPDFGLPFESYYPIQAATLGVVADERGAAVRAHNRWLADFCATNPERYVGMAALDVTDIDQALKDIQWIADAGLGGVLLPEFHSKQPLYEPRFDPMWALLAETGLVVNSHIVSSSTRGDVPVSVGELPHPACVLPLVGSDFQQRGRVILYHMVWGGVFERHPTLKVVFTEMGSDWLISALQGMDYTHTGSYLRRDIRDALPKLPSEYFRDQCHIGSSVLSRAEIAQRHEIGLDKMMVGVDWPHHESMSTASTTVDYLQATLGAESVPEEEANQLLCTNVARVYGFDIERLRPIADRVGPDVDSVLTPPEADLFPQGDVHRPARVGF